MTNNESGDLWVNERQAYSVVVEGDRTITKAERSGLSHAEAMGLAERLRRQGTVVVVMHVVGEKKYEVDRYPAR